MKLEKFYNEAYDWVICCSPRFLIGILVLFVGLWLIRMVLSRSHREMHRKEMNPTLKPFLLSLIGVALRILLVLGVMLDVP